MSAYEDALRVAMEQGPGIYSTDTSALKVTKRIVDAFLAALPPSIVVDGQVVELEKVIEWDLAKWVTDEHAADEASKITERLLDAARQVARGEER